MHVHFLTDEPTKFPKMRALLEPGAGVDHDPGSNVRPSLKNVLMSTTTWECGFASNRSEDAADCHDPRGGFLVESMRA